MILIFTHVFTVIIGFFIAKYFYLNKSYAKGKEDGAFEMEKDIFYSSIGEKENLTSEIINNKIEISYIKGFEAGQIKERKKIQVIYTPRMEIKDNYFQKTAITGYDLQIVYDGFHIGNPQYKSLDTITKFKDDNLKYVIDKVNESIVQLAKHYMDKQVDVVKAILKQEDVKVKKII